MFLLLFLSSSPARSLHFHIKFPAAMAATIQHLYHHTTTCSSSSSSSSSTLIRRQPHHSILTRTHLKNPPLKFPALATLKELCNQGNLKEAFYLLSISPIANPEETCSPILDLCASKRALFEGRQMHARMMKSDAASGSMFLGTKLVFMYGKCGSVLDAEDVFDRMRERTVFTWNAMMSAYVSNGEPLAALYLFKKMRVIGVTLDSYTFPCALKGCGAVEDLRSGAEIHGLVIKCGYDSIVFVANSLVAMYAKCNEMDAARKLFERMSERSDVVSWNSMISAYSANGRSTEALGLFGEMQKAGVSPSGYSFVPALQACEDDSFLKLGMEIHAAIIKSIHFLDVYVANALIAMYGRLGKMGEARAIFNMLDKKDNVTWNSMLTGFVQNGTYHEALQFFCDFLDAGLKPDQVSVISIAAASGRLGYLLHGKEIHARAFKDGFVSNLQVGNSLMDMYAKCCCVSYAGLVFNEMPEKDYITWTTLIAAYAQCNCHAEALELSRKVQMEGMNVDEMMIGSILLACCGLKCLTQVKDVHGYIIRRGLSDLPLQNTMVDVYGECGNIDYAARMFESITCKDVVSWTSMISCYVHKNLANEALEVFSKMKEAGVEPDSIALLSVLSATASLSALRKGKEIHGYIIRRAILLEGPVANSLVDMYARCGNLENACKLFISARNKSLVLWTTMVNAYGMHGLGKDAVKLYYKMEDQKLAPDHITFLALLYACSHSGLIEEGKRFLEIMKCKYQLEPWPEHFACLVDLLGRANRLEEAYQFVKSMHTEPTTEVWCALLGACLVHSNKELGEIALQRLLELDPDNPGNYVLVSNAFAAGGRWEDVEKVRMRMKGSGLKKSPGCSWIEVGNKVHTFVSRDKSHPERYKIYLKLSEISERLRREEGYVPQTTFVLHDVGEEEKVQMLYGHSERLAIAYGLLNTSEGTPIRITKNLRVCGDCHAFCRLVSKIFGRKLVVRDANRFHHFEDGICSCGDFW